MSGKPFHLHIFGPPAVGKMTVGYELRRLTGARLVHGHLLMDPLSEVLELGSDRFNRLLRHIQDEILEGTVLSGVSLIGTGSPPLADSAMQRHLQRWTDRVAAAGGETLYVELDAPLSVRLERNRTAFRRSHKKANWATDEVMTKYSEQYRSASEAGVTLPGRHLVIDNTNLSAADAAAVIVREFGLCKIVG